MTLPLSALLYQVTDLCDYELFHADFSAAYEGVQLFDTYTPDWQEERYLYYITDEMLTIHYNEYLSAQLLGDNLFLCYCSGDYQAIKELCPSLSVVFLQTHGDCSFSVLFNRILNTFHSFEYWDKTLHLSLLHGTSIQQLLDITKPLLSHPMLVLDANLTVIGRVHKSSEPDPYMEDVLRVGYMTPESVKSFQSLGVLPKNFRNKPLVISQYSDPDGNSYYSMCYQLQANGHVHGYAHIFHCNSHPSNSYQYLMDMVIENLSLYFKQERYSVNSANGQYEQLLTTLLSRPDFPLRQLKAQLSYIPSLSMEGYFVLARLSFPQESKVSFSFVSWNLANAFPEFKPFVYENTLYLLKTAASPQGVLGEFLDPHQLNTFLDCFSGIPFRCSLSQAFFHLTDLSLAARQCQLCEAQPLEPDSGRFLYYRDVKLSYLLQRLSDAPTLQMLDSPYYHVLKEYDNIHGSGLCEIFAQYLLAGRSITQTAAASFMHRNTVLNKVKRATQVMGTELLDYSLGFFFVLSYLNDTDRT